MDQQSADRRICVCAYIYIYIYIYIEREREREREEIGGNAGGNGLWSFPESMTMALGTEANLRDGLSKVRGRVGSTIALAEPGMTLYCTFM
jgi:hypothetical protein